MVWNLSGRRGDAGNFLIPAHGVGYWEQCTPKLLNFTKVVRVGTGWVETCK